MGRVKEKKPRRIKPVYGVALVDGEEIRVRFPGDAPPDVMHLPEIEAQTVAAARAMRRKQNFDGMITFSRCRRRSP
jgi:hypothetical protein